MSELRGIATVTIFASDLEAAAKWYSELLGIEPYFERPGYREFRIGDYEHELGIIDSSYAPHNTSTPGGAVVYWHVDDVAATFDKLLAMGAKEHDGVRARGDSGFITASVIDPFGNILGVMQNPHYLKVLSSH